MNECEKNKENENLDKEIRLIGEQQDQCKVLHNRILSEENERERQIQYAMKIYEEIEADWRRNNIMGDKENLFKEGYDLLKQSSSKRRTLLESDIHELREYTQRLYDKEEECREKQRGLRAEYEVDN